MYRITFTDEVAMTSVTLADAKLFIGITSTDEDTMITRMLYAALKVAEMNTGNIFGKKTVTITSSSTDSLYLPGVIDPDKPIVVKVDGREVGYTLMDSTIFVDAVGVLSVTYGTLESIPQPVQVFILQEVAKMYQRGVEVIVDPDFTLLEKYKIIPVC